MSLDIRIFAHSWVSDWNHGNAHFLRGLARALMLLGHRVRCYEQLGSWSLTNLVRQEGERAIEAIDDFRRAYPDLSIQFYQADESFAEFAARELRNADVVILHEWNDPHIVNTVLGLKRQLKFVTLFHDTHHRAYSSPRDILRFHLHLFDGVLAFGDAITRIYLDGFGVPRAWTFHEAADTEKFFPVEAPRTADLLWIGNWGDEERSRELEEFLIRPARAMPERTIAVHGVRYPEHAQKKLTDAGIEFRGYLPNLSSPAVYAGSGVSLHVPRRYYTNGLSGIPTIRVFEALACGAPLVCSPWSDEEKMFQPGTDYLCAADGESMRATIADLLHDHAARRQLAANGREAVLARHTCMHRARQLAEICQELSR